MTIEWEIHGLAFGNCNCDYSCPCQFHALPTHGDCRGIGFFRIDRGHFDGIPLDGLKLGEIYAWPGPIHEGHGRCQTIIDAKADAAQRAALLKISQGEEAEPFSNVFTVYKAFSDTVYEPIYTEIDFEMDMEKRTARCVARGLAESLGSPITGVDGSEHRAQICLPNGIEFRIAEVGKGQCKIGGPIPIELHDGYAQFNAFHLNRHGVID
ncbi:MAG: DUF1326 domain-containing protein [Pseudomonadota bacterium]